MTYQHTPGFAVPDPRHNDPLTDEYINRMVNQISGVVDGLIDPILEAEIHPYEKLTLLNTHLLNASLVFNSCISDRYYSPEIESHTTVDGTDR